MILKIARVLLGSFSHDELKKFLGLGAIFALIIGVYWTLQPMKDSIFMSIVGKDYLPYVQIFSVSLLIPSIMLYSLLVDRLKRHKIIYSLALFYSVATVLFASVLANPIIGLDNTNADVYRLVGWFWYFFVESFGSIMVALFWAFASDITNVDSARRGFSLIVMIGQLGSILGPLLLVPLAGPAWYGSNIPLILICAGLIALIVPVLYWFMSAIPKQEMEGYNAKNEPRGNQGFIQGLNLVFSNAYLRGVLAITLLHGAIITVVDLRFKYLVGHVYLNAVDRTLYLGNYAFWVNVCTFLCLIFGISNIQRRLGMRVALMIMPFIVGAALVFVYMVPSVSVFFGIMVLVKAFNYSLNAPAIKQLYIPTSVAVKYKSQAWIETFGSRGAQAAGSGLMVASFCVGQIASPVGSAIILSGGIFGMLSGWFLIAFFLAQSYFVAIKNQRIIC